MKQRRPPSKPRKFKRKGRSYYYAQYWDNRLDDEGNVIGRRQVQVPLYDHHGKQISTPRNADKACDILYNQVIEAWNGAASGTTLLEEYKNGYVTSHSRREGTSRSYETKLRQFFTYLDSKYHVKNFSQVKREMIKSYLDSRLDEVKLVTVHGDHRAIRAFYAMTSFQAHDVLLIDCQILHYQDVEKRKLLFA